MKTIKIFLFILLAFFVTNISSVSATYAGDSMTVTVTTPPVDTTPTATLTADSTSIAYNASTTLHISSTNSTYCTLSWPSGSNTQGTVWSTSTGSLIVTTTYTLVCGKVGVTSSPATLTVTVASPTTYTVLTNVGPNGTVSPTKATVIKGDTTSFTVTPNTGYTPFASGCGGSLVGVNYTTAPILSNCTVTATFKPDACTNGAVNPPDCSICISGYTMTNGKCAPTPVPAVVSVIADPLKYDVNPNTSVKFTYTSKTNTTTGTECRLLNYNKSIALTNWQSTTPTSITYLDGAFKNVSSYGFYVQCRDKVTTTATADSAKILVNIKPMITVGPNTNGTILPSTGRVIYGSDNTYTITPNSGYAIDELTIDGVHMAPATSYKFTNVIADHSISANFVLVPSKTTGFTASCDTSSSLKLSWKDASSSGAFLYQVFRGGGAPVYNGSGTSFIDKNLTLGSTYPYTLNIISKTKGVYQTAETTGTVVATCGVPVPPPTPNPNPNPNPSPSPILPVWSSWAPSSGICQNINTQTRYCYDQNTGNQIAKSNCAGLDSSDSDTRSVDHALCPLVMAMQVTNGGEDIRIANTNETKLIRYNSNVNVSWSSNDNTQSCTCTYTDGVSNSGSCGAGKTGSTLVSALKRNTTFTVVCKDKFYGFSDSDYVKVLIDRISAGYIEQ